MEREEKVAYFAIDMKTLLQLLQDFDGTKATCVDDLTKNFKEIAERVLFGGHFEINDKTEIFPTDIEFYYFNENADSIKELNDSRMYHKGPEEEVPYFPIMSFYPHKSGVDLTFENEEKKFRASFLIRAYTYKYYNPDVEGSSEKPTHLWEDMFGYHSICGEGLAIKWIDAPVCTIAEMEKDARINLNTDVDKKIVKDNKPWRFYKK